MKNMSFSHTTRQVRERTKTVTRRLGWRHLKAGELIRACVKCMGLKKGNKVEGIAVIRVVSVRSELLSNLYHHEYGDEEATKEGFPELNGEEFVQFFKGLHSTKDIQVVNRIEFEYVDSDTTAGRPKAETGLGYLDTAAASMRAIAEQSGVDPMALSHVHRAIDHVNEAYVCLNEPGKGRSIVELLYDIHWLSVALGNHTTDGAPPKYHAYA